MKLNGWEKENRPWGYYDLITNNFDTKVTVKVLHIIKGEMLSMQYHFKRDQLYIVVDEGFEIQYSAKKIMIQSNFVEFLKENLVSDIAKENDMYFFEKSIVHRAIYTGARPSGRIIDIAFGENDENDIKRIIDKYNRV
jgi:hypothetical protein